MKYLFVITMFITGCSEHADCQKHCQQKSGQMYALNNQRGCLCLNPNDIYSPFNPSEKVNVAVECPDKLAAAENLVAACRSLLKPREITDRGLTPEFEQLESAQMSLNSCEGALAQYKSDLEKCRENH